ncbi:Fe-S protein assembly co-chaperone HscB [Pneumocystis carinii B80]|uniref:Fe-S protein assembly co-chaperone HscB n=1 Tax=Pneumocystis carinii (strain B80) TaxID=1408658 RepID=A0A0W4ZLS0_PNEC8|nr:Fe-S protein assembly co-chaperone HscB [Pneumocystis carinii B80]KTW29336.1 Fe-S protein assembly co-chaperone HscB [Pneumocystis carinii B80]
MNFYIKNAYKAYRTIHYINLQSIAQYKARVFSSLTETNKKCENCLKNSNSWDLICSSCLFLMKLPSSIHFYKFFPKSLKEPPPEGDFHIDTKELHKEYLEIQKKVHPDIHAKNGDQQRMLAESITSTLNTAYSTLVDPVSRAHYLLSFYNISILNEDKTNQDTTFFSKIMELNEEIENLETQNDIQSIEKRINGEIQKEIMEIRSGFKILDFEIIKQATIRLKYWNNIKHTLYQKNSL